MRDARLDAQEELRDCQLQLEEEGVILATINLEEDPKVARLESEVEGLSTENDGLRDTIDELKEGMRQRVVAEKEQQTTKPPSKNHAGQEDSNNKAAARPGASLPAKPAVLCELNCIRIQLA
jgi:peptidoglycan hydrolase CwlO-like protein